MPLDWTLCSTRREARELLRTSPMLTDMITPARVVQVQVLVLPAEWTWTRDAIAKAEADTRTTTD